MDIINVLVGIAVFFSFGTGLFYARQIPRLWRAWKASKEFVHKQQTERLDSVLANIAELTSRYQLIRDDLEKADTRANRLEELLIAADNRFDKMDNRYKDDLKHSQQEHSLQMAEIKSQFAELKARYERLLIVFEKLKSENETLQTTLDKKNVQIAERDNKIVELTNTIETLNRKVGYMGRRISELERNQQQQQQQAVTTTTTSTQVTTIPAATVIIAPNTNTPPTNDNTN